MTRIRPPARALLLVALAVLGGCATQERVRPPARNPSDVRAQIVGLLPAKTADRPGWAADIQSALAALDIDPTQQNICATLAVAAQESTFSADPVVPGLGKIARAEIDRRAAQHHVPRLAVQAALLIKSPNGASYGDRLASVRTERQLSELFEDFIGMVPLGQRLFGGANPVRTGGPMQVSVDFAQRIARERTYPYPVDGSIRHEVFTRRGGIYFGIAHLLGYPVSYDRMLYRFADFNAGWYASRNAAFQNAVSIASGKPLALDGDLINYDSSKAGATELALRSLASQLDMSDARIRRALDQGDRLAFERSDLYRRVFAIAEHKGGKTLPRAVVPRITLESPKITRKLTTEWFATRVDQRYRRCLAGPPG